MSDRAVIACSLIIGASIMFTGWTVQHSLPSSVRVDLAQASNPPFATKERREALIESFKQQLQQLVQQQGPVWGGLGEITNVQFSDFSLSKDGLNIHCKIRWSKSDHETPSDDCLLKADGFGGYIGNFSIISDVRRDFPMYLP